MRYALYGDVNGESTRLSPVYDTKDEAALHGIMILKDQEDRGEHSILPKLPEFSIEEYKKEEE
jgi:hypothetical protein